MSGAPTGPTMRQALFYAPGDVRLAEVPIPVPAAGEVLVKVEVALVCGTDAKTYRRGHPVLLAQAPTPFGHEYTGTVAAMGDGVTTFEVGQRVTSANSAPCGHCYFCRREQFSLCEHLQPLLNGAYAEYLLVPARIVEVNMLRVPDGMEPERAALLEPLACVLKGLEVGDVGPGTTVGIVGLGPIGLMMTYAAASRGARVVAVGRNDHKLAAAQRVGAAALVDLRRVVGDPVEAVRELTEEGRGVDVAVEAVGMPDVWDFAVSIVRRGGMVNFFGGCEQGSTRLRRHLPAALRRTLSHGGLPPHASPRAHGHGRAIPPRFSAPLPGDAPVYSGGVGDAPAGRESRDRGGRVHQGGCDPVGTVRGAAAP